MNGLDALGLGLGSLSRISRAKTRSISAENPTGEKGRGGMATNGTGARCARDLGQGWKVAPSIRIQAGETAALAHIRGAGALQHMWISGEVALKGPLARFYILRIYWDGQEQPSVECPAADFFASGWGIYAQINSLPIAVNPNRGYNWGVNNCGWWGEGEIKFYIDGDGDFPTLCGTGTEDYFGGAYNWDVGGQYVPYSAPFMGMQPFRPDGLYRSQQRFSMYRWHIMDPIRFERDLRVTIQALGWRDSGRYLPLQDDIASVALWYQTLPTAPFPKLPDRDFLEII